MVFWVSNERKKRYDKEERAMNHLGLTDLPDEILIKILRDFPVHMACKLRLLCRKIAPAAAECIKLRLRILYIHPRSLQAAIGVCRHPIFSQSIRQVIVLGRCEFTEEGIMQTIWPFDFPTKLSEPGYEITYSFERSYKLLLEALALLPNLTELSFTRPGTRLPQGWNKRLRLCFSTDMDYINSDLVCQGGFSTTFVLFALLHQANLAFDTLKVKDHPYMRRRNLGLHEPDTDQLFGIPRIHQIQKVVYDLRYGGLDPKYARCLIDPSIRSGAYLFKHLPAFVHLKHLYLTFDRDGPALRDRDFAIPGGNIRMFDCTWPKLETLIIQHRPNEHLKTLRNQPAFILRGFRSLDRLISFFKRHACTLRKVLIDNVLFEDNVDPTHRQYIDNELILARLVDLLGAYPHLDFSYLLHRNTHAENCDITTSELPRHCFGCMAYSTVPRFSNVGRFERVANELGVLPQACDGGGYRWDFATAGTLALETYFARLRM